MNTAVALVDAYLQINGYFTIAEYPLVECFQNQPARSVTDIDLLAYRFPQVGVHSERYQAIVGSVIENVDSELQCPLDRSDMLFCEVKEGRPRFNDAGKDPAVVEAVLERFGCCPGEAIRDTANVLVKHGRATTHSGHSIRMVAFGAASPSVPNRPLTIGLDHVLDFLRSYLNQRWEYLRHTQFTHPALSFLALIEKIEAMPKPGSLAGPLHRDRSNRRLRTPMNTKK